jgi:AcrR family transcriptional regulator
VNVTGKTPIGRPRGFDADEALERAMVVFWEQGYEGATLTDLTSAMGITKTSMYAAFGNKEELFGKTLERYAEGPAAYATRALEQPTAREVATAFLTGSVGACTRPARPVRHDHGERHRRPSRRRRQPRRTPAGGRGSPAELAARLTTAALAGSRSRTPTPCPCLPRPTSGPRTCRALRTTETHVRLSHRPVTLSSARRAHWATSLMRTVRSWRRRSAVQGIPPVPGFDWWRGRDTRAATHGSDLPTERVTSVVVGHSSEVVQAGTIHGGVTYNQPPRPVVALPYRFGVVPLRPTRSRTVTLPG